jgi:Putative DNA-binding domain
MAVIEKGNKELFATFFEDPNRETLRELIKNNIGETRDLDFKEAWPKYPLLAKHVLGFANTGNACIVVGVSEKADGTLDPIGLQKLTDKADIQNGIKSYLPNELLTRIAVLDFPFDASEYPKLVGKRFQVLLVPYDVEHTPVLSLREGEGIRAGVLYLRRDGQTGEATHDELQRIINKRIETGYSTSDEITLKQHLEQLRMLYSEIPRSLSMAEALLGQYSGYGSLFRANPQAPRETYEEFVLKMIDLKKAIIAKSIGATEDMIKAKEIVARSVTKAVATPVR